MLTKIRKYAFVPNFVYIMASRPGGAIYIGRTGNLRARVQQHRDGCSTHTAKYKIKTLVWFETDDSFETSLQRERAIKRWRRAWKNQLIHETNPHWQDITAHIPA
ncbi:MAG: GIY-YIG nuclease family protein [Pseudomonadota bacterium]